MIRYLIVTADDFGYCFQRNEGIVSAFLEGGVTRSSLLVNATAAGHAALLAKQHSIPLGLHFNLTEGIPVSECGQIASLLTKSNVFKGKVGFRKTASNVDLAQVERELRAQISLFQQLVGSLPEYVDGHNHIHVLPGIRLVVAEVLNELGIRGTRVPVEAMIEAAQGLVSEDSMNFYRDVVHEAREAAKVFKSHGLRFSDGFVGMTTMGSNMTVDRLERLLIDTYSGLQHGCALTVYVTNCDSNTVKGTCDYTPMICTQHSGVGARECSIGEDKSCDRDAVLKENTSGLYTTKCDVIEGMRGMDGATNGAGDFNCSVSQSRDLVIELMTHPGYPSSDCDSGCGEGPDDFALSSERHYERNVLCSRGWRTVCELHDIRLCASCPAS